MFNGEELKDEVRSGIWAKLSSISIFYSNVFLTNGRKKSPQKLMFQKKSHCVNAPMGVVTTKDKFQGKLKD